MVQAAHLVAVDAPLDPRFGQIRRIAIDQQLGRRPLRSQLAKPDSIAVLNDGTRFLPRTPPAEDLIVAIDEAPVETVDDIQRLMVSDRIGTSVAMTVLREGRTVRVQLVPAELAV